MKKLIFEELLLMSALQKRARRVKFHPQRTVISGDNETGKSAVVKSIYASFGAAPPVTDQAWLNAEVVSLLRFKVDERRYSMLRESGCYTLFGADGKLIGIFRSVRDGLAKQLADVFDFRLRFYSATGESRAAHPAYLFAPFYVDQDKGWSNPWASFARLRSSRRLDALEYHVGIRPNAYFDAKMRLQELHEELQRPFQELDTLKRILNDLSARYSAATLNVSTESFSREIELLLEGCQRLQEQEESYRNRIMTLENERISLETQTELVDKAANELRKDYNFAVRRQGNEIECPICGARYANSIVEKFLIAQDEDRCVNFVSQLDQELARVDEQMHKERSSFVAVTTELNRINSALDTKQQQLTLREIIQAEGQRELRDKVVADIAELEVSTDRISGQIRDTKKTMSAVSDKKLRKQIKDQYAGALQHLAVLLAVSPAPEEMMRGIAPKVSASGSDLPRRLLAYYVAILQTIQRNTSGTYAPFVVDAVNQQDQGGDNLKRMFELLASALPDDTQLILSCVNTQDVSFSGELIHLDDKHAVLRVDEFDEVAEIIRPLIQTRLLTNRNEDDGAQHAST
jgi:predicted nuclease with TOPRIM domain